LQKQQKDLKKKETKKPDTKEKESAKTEEKEKEKKEPDTTEKSKEAAEEPFKLIPRVFYLTQSADRMNLFSWITTNPLQVYWSASVGSARPRIARILYRLEPDAAHKGAFTLMRSEGTDLMLAPYEQRTPDEKHKGYALLEGVKSFKITCTTRKVPEESKKEQKKEETKSATTKQQEPELVIETVTTWEWPASEEQKKESSKQPEKKLQERPLPDTVAITFVLWDALYEKTFEFTTAVPIPAQPSLERESEKTDKGAGTQQRDEKKDAQKPELPQPGAKNGTPVPRVAHDGAGRAPYLTRVPVRTPGGSRA
jgi:hypothetical protein